MSPSSVLCYVPFLHDLEEKDWVPDQIIVITPGDALWSRVPPNQRQGSTQVSHPGHLVCHIAPHPILEIIYPGGGVLPLYTGVAWVYSQEVQVYFDPGRGFRKRISWVLSPRLLKLGKLRKRSS